MKIRLDFDFDDDGQPEVVGIALDGFGWQLGFNTSGELSIHADVDLENAVPFSLRAFGGHEPSDEFKEKLALIRGFVMGSKRR